MLYIKKLFPSESAQIAVIPYTVENFFKFPATKGDLDVYLEFTNKKDNAVYTGHLVWNVNQNTPFITKGIASSFVKNNYQEGALLLFEDTEDPNRFSFDLIEITNPNYDFYCDLLDRFSQKNKKTHLVIDCDSVDVSENSSSLPLQQIYYGAPGTGKSHTINEITKAQPEDNVVRTTFHPDSDYSTFVGAYKPTTKKVAMRDVTGKIIIENGKEVTEDRIVYEFVEQAFLQAYTRAWKLYARATNDTEAQPQYLIIEEINRGNCAQIFGDLFQLLDRGDSGFSEYPIKADNDMQKQLAKAFNGIAISNPDSINQWFEGKDIAQKVLSGEVLLLPKNLYIWATMNTSDQSLFPIDSAFKRRWDWKYVPIADAQKNWTITANGNRYDWWQFLEKINAEIEKSTHSEDKKLGYFFCKAKNGTVDAETFVGKVVFYLWNDVFKDFVDESGDLFKDDEGRLTFDKFYTIGADEKTKVVEAKIERFLQNLGVKTIDGDNLDTEEENDLTIQTDNNSGQLRVELNGALIQERKSIDTFAKVIETIGPDEVASLGLTVGKQGYMLLSKERIPDDVPGDYGKILKFINGYWLLTKYDNKAKVRYLKKIADALGVNLKADISNENSN